VNLVINNPTFRDLIVSLLSTYALYFLMSFLFFEPWHMFTSFLQYLLISPSYINVFNVFAFCNIHDISWGTKGDTEQKRDLGEAKQVEGDEKYVESKIPIKAKAVNEMYLKHIEIIGQPPAKEVKVPSPDETQRDYYARFRSWVVLSWLFTNIALVAVILNVSGAGTTTPSSSTTDVSGSTSSTTKRAIDVVAYAVLEKISSIMGRADGDCGSLGSVGTEATQIYLSVVLWSVAALAAFRAIGAMWYLFARLLGR
jgi:chitin synthase